jgi:hypothetical protein
MNARTVRLAKGGHKPGEGKACLLEVVSMLAGEPFSDDPECACPVLASFGRRTNDWLNDDERQLLWQFTTRIVGSRADRETEQRRAYRMADWAVREVAPLALEAQGRGEEAAKLRALDPVVDKATARADANAAYAAANRNQLFQMSIDLLDELCPPAPPPDDAITEQIARELAAA